MYSIWFRYVDSLDYQHIKCVTLAIAQYEWDSLNNTKNVVLCTKRP